MNVRRTLHRSGAITLEDPTTGERIEILGGIETRHDPRRDVARVQAIVACSCPYCRRRWLLPLNAYQAGTWQRCRRCGADLFLLALELPPPPPPAAAEHAALTLPQYQEIVGRLRGGRK